MPVKVYHSRRRSRNWCLSVVIFVPVVDTVVVIVSSRIWVFCVTNWLTVFGITTSLPEEGGMVGLAGKCGVQKEGDYPDGSLDLDRQERELRKGGWGRHFVKLR